MFLWNKPKYPIEFIENCIILHLELHAQVKTYVEVLIKLMQEPYPLGWIAQFEKVNQYPLH